MTGAKLDAASRARFAAFARERTPAVIQAELEKIEAGYAEEAAWRKEQSQSNALRWHAVRKARGQGR